MVRNTPLNWMFVATLFLCGCKDKPKPPENTEVKQAVKPDYLAPLPATGNLAEQLQAETAGRPKDAIKTEAVLAALATAQIQVFDTKQFIGRTVLANYCFGGITKSETTVTVCEYASVDAAKAGLEHSTTQFAGIPRRTLTQNKQSVLTLVRGVDSPETKVEADKVIEVFSKL